MGEFHNCIGPEQIIMGAVRFSNRRRAWCPPCGHLRDG